LIHTDLDPHIGPIRRLAEKGEKPSFQVGPGNFKPLHPEFYDTVIWNREEAREKLCSSVPTAEFIYLDTKLTPVEIKKKEGAAK